MAVDITLEDLTTSALEGTGVFDELMKTVKLHIHEEWSEGRIKGADYASVYLGSIQAVLTQSVEFLLREKLVEAQIDGALADNALKAYELSDMLPLQKEKIEEEIDLLQSQDSELLLNGVKDRLLKDKEIEVKTQNILNAEEQVLMSAYERTVIKPKELEKLEEEIDLLQTEDLTKIYHKDNILPAQLSETLDSTLRANVQLDDSLLTTIKQREGITQDNLVKVQQVLKSEFEVNELLPAELLELQKSTDVKERGMVEQESTGEKQRTLLDTEEQIKNYENEVLQLDQHLTNLKQQMLLDTQEESEQFKVDNLLPKELEGLEEDVLTKYVLRVGKDKEVATMGLDRVVKDVNIDPEDVYTPKYIEEV